MLEKIFLAAIVYGSRVRSDRVRRFKDTTIGRCRRVGWRGVRDLYPVCHDK